MFVKFTQFFFKEKKHRQSALPSAELVLNQMTEKKKTIVAVVNVAHSSKGIRYFMTVQRLGLQTSSFIT